MRFLSNRLQVLTLSLLVSLIVVGLKWWSFLISNSVALKTDALESVLNIAATLLAITAIYHAARPADATHPYGHGKIEYFSAAIEGGMMLFASLYLFYEGVKGLVAGSQLADLSLAFAISCVAALLNAALGAWQLRQGKKLKSEAIIADARHLLSDFYTTCGILVGLILVRVTGYTSLDAIMGIVVALALFYGAFRIIEKAAMALSDSEDPQLIQKMVETLNSPERPAHIIDVHHLRTFRSGSKNFIDLHVVVPEFWDIRRSHDEGESYCLQLARATEDDCEFHPHTEPCWQKYCARCAVENCPVRRVPFAHTHIFTESEVTAPGEDDLALTIHRDSQDKE